MTGEPFDPYAFEAMYDPSGPWRKKPPFGGQENARRASAAVQEARVRSGQVHVYNNLYRADINTRYRSSWGVGLESRIHAENNFFDMNTSYSPLEAIDGKKGSQIATVGNCWRKGDACEPLDFVGEWNARFDPDLNPDAGWVPQLYGPSAGAEPAADVRARVLGGVGPGRKSN